MRKDCVMARAARVARTRRKDCMAMPGSGVLQGRLGVQRLAALRRAGSLEVFGGRRRSRNRKNVRLQPAHEKGLHDGQSCEGRSHQEKRIAWPCRGVQRLALRRVGSLDVFRGAVSEPEERIVLKGLHDGQSCEGRSHQKKGLHGHAGVGGFAGEVGGSEAGGAAEGRVFGGHGTGRKDCAAARTMRKDCMMARAARVARTRRKDCIMPGSRVLQGRLEVQRLAAGVWRFLGGHAAVTEPEECTAAARTMRKHRVMARAARVGTGRKKCVRPQLAPEERAAWPELPGSQVLHKGLRCRG